MSHWRRYPRYRSSGVEWLGEVPEGWTIIRLKNLLKKENGALKTGPFGSQLLSSTMEGGNIKVYTQDNIISKNGNSGYEYISEEKFNELKSFEVFPNDILITSRGTLGKTLQLPINATKGILHPCLIRIKLDDEKIISKFFQLFFEESDLGPLQIKLSNNSTTVGVIYSNTVKNFLIFLPPFEDQRTITTFLKYENTRVDALIVKKERQIEVLMEKRGALISHTVTTGIDPNTKMKDSNVEWIPKIPEHWDEMRARDLYHQLFLPPESDTGIVTVFRDGEVTLRKSDEPKDLPMQYWKWVIRA